MSNTPNNCVDVTEVVREMDSRSRLEGYVHLWKPVEGYGFISVPGMEEGGKRKQWHFHRNSLRSGTRQQQIGAGVKVKFTPVPIDVPDKCDKATDIEVVG